jgi:1,4-dihydroxy-2-naphthoate octaprenyltransferase
VVKIGLNNARIYHWFLIIGAFVSLVFFIYVNLLHWIQFLSLLAFIPIMMQGIKVQNLAPSPKYNALLKQLSLSILLLVVIFVVLQTVALGIFVSNTINNFVK